MMPRMIVIIIALDAVLLGAATTVHAQEVDDITLEDIWAVFRARQEQVETAKVTWNYRFVMSEYSAADTLANEPEGPQEASDIVFPEQICRLSVADDRLRYESPIPVFAHGQGGAPTRNINAFDGTEEQSFTESLSPDTPHYGSLRQSKAPREWNMIHLQALTYALRPLRAELFGPEPGEWRILDNATVIDGRKCIVLELQHAVDPAVTVAPLRADRVYLDPEHGFRLLRHTAVGNNEEVTIQVDARYEGGDAPDWCPTRWTWRPTAPSRESCGKARRTDWSASFSTSRSRILSSGSGSLPARK